MSISQKSLKKEIFAAYLESQNQIETLKKEIEILENRSRTELISMSEYKDDFQKRMSIHDSEINFAKRDLINLINWVKENSKSIRKEISLFPIK